MHYLRLLEIVFLLVLLGLGTIGGCGGGSESQGGRNRGFVCPRCFTPLNDGLCVCSCTDMPDGTSQSCHACSFLGVVFDDFCEVSNSPCPTSPCPPDEESTSVQMGQTLSEYVTVFQLENGCDIFAGMYSEYECEAIAYDRQCKSMEVIPSDTDTMPMECWFYDCQECLLGIE